VAVPNTSFSLFPSMSAHNLALGILSILTAVGSAAGQIADITCLTTYSWMTNTLGQNPCVIASYLEGACFDVTFTISALPTGSHYEGPSTPSNGNDCICSSVVYSLVSACAICQGGLQISKWSAWKMNCSTSDIDASGYSIPIPGGTAVPNWAYQNVVGEDTFDVNIAFNDSQSNPSESSAAGSGPTSTTSSSSSSSTPVGAIVGGVVGGLFGLGLIIIVVVYFWMKRRRARNAAPNGTAQMAQAPIPTPSPFAPTPYPYDTTATPSTVGGAYLAPTKLYDPNDPTTFPTDAPTLLSHSPAPTSQGFYSTPGSPPPQPVRGQYSGVPEL